MTEKEFKKFLDSLADDTDRDYAIDAWDSMVASERAECTAEDMEGYIEDTYKAVEEQKLRDVSNDKIFVAVLDDGYYLEHGDYPEEFDSDLAYEGFEFDTPEEFVAKWQELEDGAWYWVFDKGEIVCSGAIDPNDIEIFEEHWDRSFDELEPTELEPKEYVITMSSGGGTVRDFLTCDSREEAEEICESYDWCFVDENAFEWSLDIDERDIVSLDAQIAEAKREVDRDSEMSVSSMDKGNDVYR